MQKNDAQPVVPGKARKRVSAPTVPTHTEDAPELTEHLRNLYHTIHHVLEPDLKRALGIAQVHAESPALFMVIDHGKKHGPMTREDLGYWRDQPCDVLYDLTRNAVQTWNKKRNSWRSIEPRKTIPRRNTGIVRDLLRIFAEYPGFRFNSLVANRLRKGFITRETFRHYVSWVRGLLGDDGRDPKLILTDTTTATSFSGNGAVYYANDSLSWRVIKYLPDLCDPISQ